MRRYSIQFGIGALAVGIAIGLAGARHTHRIRAFVVRDEAAHSPQDPHVQEDSGQVHSTKGKTSQMTVRGKRFEVFIKHPFIVAGLPAEFITHVSDMTTLKPRTAGAVTFILDHDLAEPIRHVENAPINPI